MTGVIILPTQEQPVGNNSSAALIAQGYSQCLKDFAALNGATVPLALLRSLYALNDGCYSQLEELLESIDGNVSSESQ